MKTILGLIGGGDRDEVILRTALAAAVPLSAHLDFLHVHVSAGRAARHNRVEFAGGNALRNALDQLETKAKTFSEVAADHVRAFCARSQIEICEAPSGGDRVTASFREEKDAEIERLISHASNSDLVVLGRAKQTQGLSPDTLERLVLNCGRPLLLAATAAPKTLTGTVMVCWDNSENAARAVAEARPLLSHAKRLVFTTVADCETDHAETVHDLARQFAGKGTTTEIQVIQANGGEVPHLLATAAEDCAADLLVMGAYGHSRMRELIFGSRTAALVGAADRPLFLMH